jgi:hypothetical protein
MQGIPIRLRFFAAGGVAVVDFSDDSARNCASLILFLQRPPAFRSPLMSKIEIDLVAEVLKDNELEEDLVMKIVRQLTRAAEKLAAEAEAEKEPTTKKQWVILLSDPNGDLPDEDMVGWVVQIPENDNPGTVTGRIVKAAHHFNTTRRGRKHPAKSIAEACEVVGGKFLKEQNLAIKTKLPVTALKTDNVLPTDEGSKISMDDLRRRF